MLVLVLDALVRTGLSPHPTHMMSISAVRLFFWRLPLRHQLHPAFGAFARFVGDNLGMHNADVLFGGRGGWRSVWGRRCLRIGAFDRANHRDHSQERNFGFQMWRK